MLNIFKRLFLIGFAIFFVLATWFHIPYVYYMYKGGELENEIIPKIKYILSDMDLLFPTNDYQQCRRIMIWRWEEYVQELNNLNLIENGYVVSKADFENEAPNTPFSQWKYIHKTKDCRIKLFLLLFGGLSETQKQAILDFYKIYDKAYYELAKEIVLIKNPKSMRDLDYIIDRIMHFDDGFSESYVKDDGQKETVERQENEN